MSKARDLADSVAAGSVLADGVVSLSEVGGGTNNGVVYVNGTGTTTSGSGLTYNGTTFGVTGNTTLGDASTDTVTVNGYMGVGGAANAAMGVRVIPSALTGGAQYGIVGDLTGTSAATGLIAGIWARAQTAAATYTTGNLTQFYAAGSVKGAGSTITNQHGVYIADQTQGTNNYGITSLVSSGTNKWNIYASGTATNYFAGNVGIGASSPATKLHLKLAGSSDGFISESSSNDDFIKVAHDGTVGYISTSYLSTGGYTPLVFKTSNTERLRLSTTEAVFNDPGNDYDFRVESDTNTHMLFVDAGNNRIGINNNAPSGMFTVNLTGTANITNNTQTKLTDYSAASRMGFTGRTNNNDGVYFGMESIPTGIGFLREAAGWDTQMRFYTNNITSGPDGTNAMQEKMRIWSSGVTINEDGGDYDFRVESDTNTHALFVDAGNSRVGINKSAPNRALDVHSGTASDITTFANDAGGYTFGYTASLASWDLGATDSLRFRHGSTETLRLKTTESVFNENGADIDFRVESDTNQYALFVDAGDDSVTTASTLRVGGTTNATALGGVNTGIVYFRNSYTPSNNHFDLDMEGLAGAQSLTAYWYDGSVYRNRMALAGNVGETSFNDYSDNIDFRVESNNQTHMLFVDAGNDRVGIKNSAPQFALDVGGAIGTTAGVLYNVHGSTNTSTITMRITVTHEYATSWYPFAIDYTSSCTYLSSSTSYFRKGLLTFTKYSGGSAASVTDSAIVAGSGYTVTFTNISTTQFKIEFSVTAGTDKAMATTLFITSPIPITDITTAIV